LGTLESSRRASLILKRAPIGWNQNDFDVLENGKIVGRIFFLDAVGPQGRPWMWTSNHNGNIRASRGYEPTREAAMAAFAKSWRAGQLSGTPDIEVFPYRSQPRSL
jgi:hypothetical protein